MKLLADQSFQSLDELFPDFNVETFTTITPEQLKDVDVLITRANVQLNEALLANSSIKVVASPTSGFDHFDQAWLLQANITWFYAPGCNAMAVAEYVLACTALLCQLIPGPYCAGVIGVGNIGTIVTHYFQQLGFEVLQNDPCRAQQEENFSSVPLSELANCDLITCHVPLTHAGDFPTYHLLDETFLKTLKPGCAIINTARGEILDTQAALQQMQRLTFIADVFENEPRINADFVEHSFLATPHIAGHSLAGKQRGLMMCQQQIYKHFNLTPPKRTLLIETVCCLPPERWEQTVLQTYNPTDDQLLDVNQFSEQRNHYRKRLEHTFIFN